MGLTRKPTCGPFLDGLDAWSDLLDPAAPNLAYQDSNT
jgi:hypothetical protein